MAAQRKPRVIVLDDEKVIADTLSQILQSQGYDAHARYTAGKTLDLASDYPPDLLVTDVALGPDTINGIDVAIYFERFFPHCKVLLISGHAGTADLHAKAAADGHDFRLLHKPIHPEDLLAAVAETIEERRAA